ncbi:calcium-independent phospholipase A2-gamma [Penicillium riverlandense]|uniref:calcium-independent phospholipase A2-gamma n=1 Tax=Penicillium riverlandense TaxID=1903569 RepID=UPI002549761C|nr:calcium-independent phospholipase A2-gamma [Penicillium riverlandense]KAJ5820348.1 calcium-independent phospholipase A2-gamma [Penicillium riverlandense]
MALNPPPSTLRLICDMVERSPYLTTAQPADAAERSKDFRFNVDRGLDITLSGWEQDSTVPARTRSYLSEQTRTIEKFVDVFTLSASSIGRFGDEPSYSDSTKINKQAKLNLMSQTTP